MIAALWAIALAAALLLLASGVEQSRRPKWLRATLQAQAVLPPSVHALVVGTLGPVELLLGALMLVGWLAGLEQVLRVGLTAATVLCAAFASYLFLVLRRSPNAPCGCFGNDRVSWWSIGRAALLALACAGAALTELPDGRALVTLAAVVVALMLWLLPQLTGLGAEPERTAR